MNEKLLVDKANELGIENELTNKLKQYFNIRLMNKNEVKEWLLETVPDIGFLLEKWGGENNQLSKLQLTSVGIALAQANYKQKITNIDFDLGIWIK